MAAAESVSDLRVVLLGGSWTQRNFVGNFILGNDVFSKIPETFFRVSEPVGEQKVTVINTPDLQFSTQESLAGFVKDCAKASDPGPHVFVLVVKPEDLNEGDKDRIFKVLDHFNDQSFDYSLLLIMTRKQDNSPLKVKDTNNPLLKDLIKKCKYRSLKEEDMDHAELLSRFYQIVKENDGQYVSYEAFEETPSNQRGNDQNQTQKTTSGLVSTFTDGLYAVSQIPAQVSSFFTTPSSNISLKIFLIGRSGDKKTKLTQLISGMEKGYQPKGLSSTIFTGKWKAETVKVVKIPDMFSMATEAVVEEIQRFQSVLPPGPNVLLLLVKPSKFNEKDRKTLNFLLSLFGQDALKFSIIVMTHLTEISVSLNDLLKDCEGRHYNMTEGALGPLMENIEDIIKNNPGKFLNLTGEIMGSQQMTELTEKVKYNKPSLNLVLCGGRREEKISVAKAILGQIDLPSASNSSECVRNQGEVHGRWVSLVELPALNGKAQQEVMEESFRCISLCEPEGVHTFILVLPVGPLTDEDKGELQTIQDTFSSRVNDFTMILFTVDSDPRAPAVVNFINKSKDIQELLQSCGGRYVVFNVKDRKQIPELMKMMDRAITDKKSQCVYKAETFLSSQIENNIKHVEHITRLEAEIKKLKKIELVQGEEIDQNSRCLRIVLIGKTGCGKSSSANTILGRRVFEAKAASESVTKLCQKKQCVVDGRPVAVVDTPGLFDDSLSHEEVYDETLKCMSLLAPGPHVFLLVLQIGRITPEEKETLRLIKEGFGKGAEKFTIILFTNGDKLEYEEQTIEDYIGVNDYLKKLISDCGGRCHVFNNYDKKNQTQVSELIRKIDMMVKENNNRFYSNEMLQEAEAAVLKKTEKILKEKEEEMRREKEELKRKYDEEMQEMRRTMEEHKEQLKQEAEQRLKEIKENIDKEQKQRELEKEERENEKRKRESEEINYRQSLIKQLENLDKQIQSEIEEKKTVSRELENTRKEKQKYKEAWEKERNDWWERREEEEEKRKQEEKRKMRELEEQYKKEHERYEEERKKEEQIRREQEEKERKKWEEKLERVQKEYEEKAREEAVRSNEFQEKYKKEFAEQKEELKKQMKDKDEKYDLLKALAAHKEAEKRKQYQTDISNLVSCISKKKENLTKIKDLLTKHEQETKQKKTEKEKEELQKNHEKQISELVEKLLKETKSSCCIL